MNLYKYQISHINSSRPAAIRFMLADPITRKRSVNSASISNLSCIFYDDTSGKIWDIIDDNVTIMYTFEFPPTEADLRNLFPEEFI